MRRRLGIPREAKVVVCTARMVRRKGQDTLIRAWPGVLHAHPGAFLMLVGDGPDRPRLQRMVERRRLGESVIFTGSVAWDEVPAYMDAGDVFAMPCRTRLCGLEPEAWGIVFLEAQACGLPVLIGRSGGAPETLLDPAAGLVVESDTETVRAGLVALIDGGRRPEVASTKLEPVTWARVNAALRRLLN